MFTFDLDLQRFDSDAVLEAEFSAQLRAPAQALLRQVMACSGAQWGLLLSATSSDGGVSGAADTMGTSIDWEMAAGWAYTLAQQSDEAVTTTRPDAADASFPPQTAAVVRVEDSDKNPLGILALLHDTPWDDVTSVLEVLDTHRALAASLLQQKRTIRDLQQRMRRLERLERQFQELSAQQAIYQHLAARLEEVIWVWKDDTLLFISPTYETIFGRSREVVYASPEDFLNAIVPPDRERVRVEMESGLRAENGFKPTEQFDVEYAIDHPERGRRLLRSRAFAVQAGGEVYHIGITEDVTEARTRQQALQSAYERLRSYVEHSPLASVEFDQNYRVVRWSPQAERLFGYSEAEMIGRDFKERGLIHPDDLSIVRENLIDWDPSENRGIIVRNRNVTRDGDVLHCVWYNSALVNENGTVTSVFSIIQDVTERVQYEAEILAAREEAERANRLKTAFLSNLTHEIRTPLTAIIGFADIIQEEENSRFGKIIVRSASNLLQTIESVLEIARLQSEEVKLQYRDIDVAALVRKTAEEMTPLIRNDGVDLHVDAPDEAVACVDPGALRRIVTNLVSNALKYTDDGHVRVALFTTSSSVRLDVEDTGIGIAEADREAIFEEFRQSENSDEPSRPGTGLGLSITQHLVHLHNGTMTLKSKIGDGSTFTVTLPRFPPPSVTTG